MQTFAFTPNLEQSLPVILRSQVLNGLLPSPEIWSALENLKGDQSDSSRFILAGR